MNYGRYAIVREVGRGSMGVVPLLGLTSPPPSAKLLEPPPRAGCYLLDQRAHVAPSTRSTVWVPDPWSSPSRYTRYGRS